MSDGSSHLPAHPSFEQLQKQAKELIRSFRSGDVEAANRLAARHVSRPPTLADAQFVIAREYGFASWASLKRHIEELLPPGMEQYERLASDLAAAYLSGDSMAIREVNWSYGTGFPCDFHEGDNPQQRLKTWFAAENRSDDLALADARQMVAHFYGFPGWREFRRSVLQPERDPKSAPLFFSSRPPFYEIDWVENRISVRGPQSADDWEQIAGIMKEHGIARLNSAAMSDAGLDRISRLDMVTHLEMTDSQQLSDDGVQALARMPQLLGLEIGGWTSRLTDRALPVLTNLQRLRDFKCVWTRGISDAGAAHLKLCSDLENVNLMGTATGDGALRALAEKERLRHLHTGALVSDEGIHLLRSFPRFVRWSGENVALTLLGRDDIPTRLTLDGPFTNAGLARLKGLDGLAGLGFFWHCPAFTSGGLTHLRSLPHLQSLAVEGTHCDDDAMTHIGRLAGLRKLLAQGTVASDAGFEQLSASQSLEFIWGRECENLSGRGFRALSTMPALRGIAVSCKSVGDAAMALLPAFPSLTELMPMDVPDSGFRHVGRCPTLERLWCMYCRDTGDLATEHLSGLKQLRTYYAGMTRITDRSLELLSRMTSLEQLEFWSCAGISDAGVRMLAALPRLREISVFGSPDVTMAMIYAFRSKVRVRYSG